MKESDSDSEQDFIGQDITELILSYLPIPSIIRSSSVCKLWNSTIHSNSFKTRISNSRKSPWFFICTQSNGFSNKSHYQASAFDPESDSWIRFPDTTTLLPNEAFAVSNGFFFATSLEKFSFKPVLNKAWLQTSPLNVPRYNPLIGVYNSMFIVVGGIKIKHFRSATDIRCCLDVEIYAPDQDSWELCPPVPDTFGCETTGNLSSLSSAAFEEKFYLYSNSTNFITSFDLRTRLWSEVRTIRPPGIRFSCLIPCRDWIVLAGFCNAGNGVEFVLWRIDERTLEFAEMGIMPQDMIPVSFDGDHDFARLKLVGCEHVVYIYGEECLCVCEMSDPGACRWRRVPTFPGPVNDGFKEFLASCTPVKCLLK